MRLSLFFILLTSLFLTACGSSERQPTPTIVLLDRSSLVQVDDEGETAEISPTATRLPLPSSTPTPTPLLVANLDPITVTATPVVATVIATPTLATASQKVEILSAALNVRQGPGMTYEVIETVQQGDLLTVTGIDKFGDWLQVELDNNRYGWVSAQSDLTRLVGGSLDEISVIQATTAAVQIPLAQPRTVEAVDQTQNSERLVFTTRSGGDLYVINIDGTGLRNLAAGVIDPVVSPNGQQVAFTRWDGAEFGVLYTLDIETGNERAIVGDIRQPKSPTWSPDGQQLLISFQHGGLRDPQRECRTFGPGERVTIPENAVIDWVRTVPKNGEGKICFTRREDLQWYLRQVNVSTGQFEDLPSDQYAFNPAWDPENPWRVIYDGEQGLMQLDLVNDQQLPVTEDIRDTGPVFSPDGQILALTYKQHDHWEVYTLDPATQARSRLTKPPILADPQYNSAAPAWSPDGKQIAFVTDRTGSWEIWGMNADGSNQRPLFAPETQSQFDLFYAGVNEHLLNWID